MKEKELEPLQEFERLQKQREMNEEISKKSLPLVTANFCLNRFKLTLENNEKDRSGFKIQTNKFVINCTKFDESNEQTPYDFEVKMAVRSANVYSM
jgi:hypothetical protein